MEHKWKKITSLTGILSGQNKKDVRHKSRKGQNLMECLSFSHGGDLVTSR